LTARAFLFVGIGIGRPDDGSSCCVRQVTFPTREMEMQPSLERALRRKEILGA
jgi:hypothetical protein